MALGPLAASWNWISYRCWYSGLVRSSSAWVPRAGDAPALQHQDLVGALHRGEAVGDDDVVRPCISSSSARRMR